MDNFILDKEALVHILAVATEGSDWLWIDYPKRFDRFVHADSECREDRWVDILVGDGYEKGYIIAVDYNDEEEDGEPGKEYDLAFEDFQKGFLKFVKECPQDYADLMSGHDDYYTCNNLMQCVMFGEVIYG